MTYTPVASMKNMFFLLFLAQWFNLAFALPSAIRANPDFPDPLVDPFYAQPADIANYRPGQIIRRREIPSAIVGAFASVYQVFFRTTDGQGRPVGTVSTVWAPLVPSFPPKVFSYQVAEDSTVLDCAPSWGWVQNSDSHFNTVEKNVQGPLLIPWATAIPQGYYVVSTDAEGPQSAWLVGKMEGQAGLDGIRATLQLHNLAAPLTTAALYGYSGGAHTTIWMASLAETYAPELRIVGAAYGGTPIDLESALDAGRSPPVDSVLVGGGIFGLANGYAGPGSDPDLNATVNALLNDEGRRVAALFRSPNYCFASPDVTLLRPTGVTDYSTIFTGDFFNSPELQAVFAKESLLSDVSSVLPVPVPKFPRFQYHGDVDEVVPYGPVVTYVQQQCARGANIQFVTFQGQGHAPAAISGVVPSLRFIQQSFSNTTPQVQCGTTNNQLLPGVGSLEADQILGSGLSDFLTSVSSGLGSGFAQS